MSGPTQNLTRHYFWSGEDETADHYVYRHHDSEGRLLYVGCTKNPKQRMRSHELHSPWWPQIDRIAIDGPWVRGEALSIEWALICTYQPAHNHVGTQKWLDDMRARPARRKDRQGVPEVNDHPWGQTTGSQRRHAS